MEIQSEESTEELLHLLVGVSNQNFGQTPHKPTCLQWSGVISAKCGQTFDVKQMRTKYPRFRNNYLLFTAIKNDTGLGWDEKKQTVTCPDWKWDEYCQVSIWYESCT